ncbi:uncharacterized protein C8R40DRAFT_1131098 [Lentinula edodes]|uniref:uncharacterized protein n=1 Tax=Lentinula edodes TaxID=5353 RepID=UPI001E8E9D67|nr:uncharacterized protein C8R40DRAFT_1131098 [Lentinula edodes]KAH7869292.1 hypothetical protein C8R40DRAFT_1131098 [Lentinula edodes]
MPNLDEPHDLESLFYIMLCLACRYKKPGLPTAEARAYSKWFSGTDEEVFVRTPSLPHPP